LAKPFPHAERHGVALLGIVEGDDADAIVNALQNLAVGEGFFDLAFGNI
jgi:hypothetical protein